MRRSISRLVRDHNQKAFFEQETIKVISMTGRRISYSYTISVTDWRNISRIGNYEFNRREFLEKKMPQAITTEENSLRQRIIDAQIKAITAVVNE
jgi:hypothetical protein